MTEMNERIEKIRALLAEVEGELRTSDDRAFVKNFDALEVPQIVTEVVRYLQPLLTPYEAAVYWHMFERAVLRSGDQYCRVSTRALMSGVVGSASGQSETLSIQTTRGALQGLEDRGAIQRVGEPTRDGTPYRVLLPEEIPACRDLMKSAQPSDDVARVDVAKDLDYDNVRENRLKVFERDGLRLPVLREAADALYRHARPRSARVGRWRQRSREPRNRMSALQLKAGQSTRHGHNR